MMMYMGFRPILLISYMDELSSGTIIIRYVYTLCVHTHLLKSKGA